MGTLLAEPAGGAGALLLIGSYTRDDVLPHFPLARPQWGVGITLASFVDGRIVPRGVVPVLNPAFQKFHPTLPVLYVLSECIDQEGQLHAFAVGNGHGAPCSAPPPPSSSSSPLPPSSAAALVAADAAAMAYAPPARLTPLAPAPLPMTGRSTCYIAFAPCPPNQSPRHAVVANYWDGVVDVVSLCPRTGAPRRVVQRWQQSRRASWRQVEDRLDHMTNRQDGPHAHCAAFSPSGRWLFVPDLGDNGIHQYRWDARAAREAARLEDAALERAGGGTFGGGGAGPTLAGATAASPLAPFSGPVGLLAHEAFVPLPAGDGPRHLVFHPRLPVAYSGCELRSRVQVFAVDEREDEDEDALCGEGGGEGAAPRAAAAPRPRIAPVQSMSTLPDGWLEGCDAPVVAAAPLTMEEEEEGQARADGGGSSASSAAGDDDDDGGDKAAPAAAPAAADGPAGSVAALDAARLLHCGQGARRVNYVGEIRVSPDGRAVYASNRGHHSVAAFSVDPATGFLSRRIGVTGAGGACPRHFNLSPCGRWLVVGAQDSDAVAALARCPETGALAPLGDDHGCAGGHGEEAAAAAMAAAAAAAMAAACPRRLAAAAERGRYVSAPCPNFVLFAPEHVVSAVSTPASSAQGGAGEARPLASSSSGGGAATTADTTAAAGGGGAPAAAGGAAPATTSRLGRPPAAAAALVAAGRASGSGSASVRMSEDASFSGEDDEEVEERMRE